jgi:hypothetical protein
MPDSIKGFDADQDCRPALPAARAAGVGFVCRYLKNLTPGEAVAFAQAGIKVVAIWEQEGEATLEGATRGSADAANAVAAMKTLGVPSGQGAAIYSAMDFNAKDHQIAGPISAYFAAWSKGLGDDYLPGAYGNGAALKSLLEQKHIVRAWLWGVDGSNGTPAFRDSNAWHLRQRPPQGPGLLANSLGLPLEYDPDFAQQDDFGGFLLQPRPANPADVRLVLAAVNLKQGDTGPAVAAAQRLLLAKGQDPGTPDAVFGAHTVAAVEGFQRAEGLAPDGVIGPPTKAKLTAS